MMCRGATRVSSKYVSKSPGSIAMCSPHVTVPKRGHGIRTPFSSQSRGVCR